MDFSNLHEWKIKKLEKNNYFKIFSEKWKTSYIGEIYKKKPNGLGIFQDPLYKYEGYWKNGIQNGNGILYEKGKKIYSGNWENGLWNGKGILYYPDGKKNYSGEFKNNFFHGEGTFYNKKGDKIYQGSFDKSKFSGFGYLFQSSLYKIFEGEFSNNKKNGFGTEFDRNGNKIFEGEFKNNKKNGYGYEFIDNFPCSYFLWKNNKKTNPYTEIPKNLHLLQSNLGKGGFGSVKLYENMKTKKKYAAKFFNSERNIINEFSNLNFLKKKKVCKPYFLCPYGIYKENHKFIILFDYLKNYITFDKFRLKKISLSKKKKVSSQIWKQICLLHEIGMIHSDIKPSNIMVNPNSLKVHIIDFGCSIIFHNKNPNLKFNIFGLTKKYFNLRLGKSYTSFELKENDLKTTSRIILSYLDKKGLSFEERKKYINEHLM